MSGKISAGVICLPSFDQGANGFGSVGLLLVFKFLSPVELLYTSVVCKLFHQVISSNLLFESFWWTKVHGSRCRDGWAKVLEFLLPRDLLRVSSVCKPLRSVILEHPRLVIQAGMLQGGRSKTSLVNLYRLMDLRAIYIPDPLRILRLINGLRCEFCNKFGCNFVRGSFGVFACWDCLHGNYDHVLGFRDKSTGLSQQWHKVVYLGTRVFFIKQYYHVNRYILFDIFNHRRILSQPGGKRWVKLLNGELVSTTTSTTHIVSKDAAEVMWGRIMRDLCGNLIGPLFCKNDVSLLVEKIKEFDKILLLQSASAPRNEASIRHNLIDRYFDEDIESCPKECEYKSFMEGFNYIKAEANLREFRKLS